MNVYSASEARKLWRVLLDRAVAGETIHIERSGVDFILKATDKSPFVPEFKHTPPVETFADGSHGYTVKSTKKNNLEGKPSKRNICPQHLVDKDTCKLMKHKA